MENGTKPVLTYILRANLIEVFHPMMVERTMVECCKMFLLSSTFMKLAATAAIRRVFQCKILLF